MHLSCIAVGASWIVIGHWLSGYAEPGLGGDGLIKSCGGYSREYWELTYRVAGTLGYLGVLVEVYWDTTNMKGTSKETPELLEIGHQTNVRRKEKGKRKTPPVTLRSCHCIHRRNAAGKKKRVGNKTTKKKEKPQFPIIPQGFGQKSNTNESSLSVTERQ